MRRDSTGSVIAAALRADVEAANAGSSSYVAYTCRGCERPVGHSLTDSDGWCDTCNGVDRSAEDAARRREAARAGHIRTAQMLRRLGFPGRAAVHDAEAGR